jgi:hypothetical protein
MSLAALSGIFGRGPPLGHFVWWSSPGSGAPVEPASLDLTRDALLALPVLDRSGVFWVAQEFSARLAALRGADAPAWELHAVPVWATPETLTALRASALHATERSLGALAGDLGGLLLQPRARASLLVRQHDALEDLRRRATLYQRCLGLELPSLALTLDEWARRIDGALCARIVA